MCHTTKSVFFDKIYNSSQKYEAENSLPVNCLISSYSSIEAPYLKIFLSINSADLLFSVMFPRTDFK